MQRVIISLIFVLSMAVISHAQSLSVEALVREATVSNALSDRFKAYRVMAFLKEKRTDVFMRQGVSEYLEAFYQLSSTEQFEQECTKLSQSKTANIRDQILYTCGRLLVDGFTLQKAAKFLEQVQPISPLFVQTSLVYASILLSESEGEKCLKRLDSKFLTRIKNQNTKDLYFLTRARCLVDVQQMDEAIVQYQQISAQSVYYFDALEESAWAQFKLRRLESARTLIDVIVTSHETGVGSSKTVSAPAYFRMRYLQAYIELVQKNAQKAEMLFRSLRDSVAKYSLEKQFDEEKVKKLTDRIIAENSKWLDLKAMPREITEFLAAVRDWGDNRQRKRLDRLIDFQYSITREIERLTKNPSSEFEGYASNLLKIRNANSESLKTEMLRSLRNIDRSLNVFRIKSDLGRLEIIWSERAQGVRGIGELLEAYQQEVNDVEDFF